MKNKKYLKKIQSIINNSSEQRIAHVFHLRDILRLSSESFTAISHCYPFSSSFEIFVQGDYTETSCIQGALRKQYDIYMAFILGIQIMKKV